MPQPPDCVGTYEEDHTTCNGQPRGKSEEDRAPCAWLNRCVGLLLYCADRGEVPEFVVAHRTYEQLVRLCEQAIGEHGVVNGVVGAPTTEQKKPSTKKRKPAPNPTPSPSATPRQRRRQRRSLACRIGRNSPQPAFRELVKRFEAQLRKGLPGVRFVTNGVQVLVRPGAVYRIDRTARTGYVAWYCTTLDGPRPLARVRFLPRTEELNVEIPITKSQLRKCLAKDAFASLNVRAWVSGYFHSRCQHLGDAAVDLCATTVAELVLDGSLRLRGCFGS